MGNMLSCTMLSIEGAGLGFDFSSITNTIKSAATATYNAARTVVNQVQPALRQGCGVIGSMPPVHAYVGAAQAGCTAYNLLNPPKAPTAPRTPTGTIVRSTSPRPMPSMAPVGGPPQRIARFNRSRGVWSVYVRSGLSGMGVAGAELLGGACIFGNCNGLGAEPDPAVPAGYTKESEAAAKPADAVDAGMEQDKPFYKNWRYYAIAGGGLAVLGAGYYLLGGKRRRRR